MWSRYIILSCLILLQNCSSSIKTQNTLTPKKDTASSIPYYPLQEEGDLDLLLKKIGNARFVLLGEASHGTSEFQQWRAMISKRLIAEKGFRCIVMEGDWNEMLEVNKFIQGGSNPIDSARKLLSNFQRWPTWLWANEEFASFITWANAYNQSATENEKLNMYGFDLYGVGPSIDSSRKLTQDPTLRNILDTIEACYKPYWADALKYSTAVHDHVANCAGQMQELIQSQKNFLNHKIKNEADFILVQHLQTILNGERYFRLLAQNQSAAWNIRDQHMAETIQRLVELYGKGEKIIVWAHNSHVGDATYTDMPQRGRTNLGAIMRRKYGDEQVFIIGFGMYAGEVTAAYKWGDSMHRITIAPAYPTSWEDYLHKAGEGNKIVFTNEMQRIIPLNHWYDQRAIGVLYHPDRPRSSYTPSYISRRYDAFIFIDDTHAIEPVARVRPFLN